MPKTFSNCLSIYLIYLFIYSPFLHLSRFFSVLIQYTVGRIPWTGISPTQSCYLYTGQHNQNKSTDTHALSGIRTHDPSVGVGEDSSWFRPHSHWDRHIFQLPSKNDVMINVTIWWHTLRYILRQGLMMLEWADRNVHKCSYANMYHHPYDHKFMT
jgi:hypothetical protein